MKLEAYAAEAQNEETHWWFVGRRALFARTIRRMNLSPQSNILDIGTSTGTNLRMLRGAGYVNVRGVDLSPTAQRYCLEKGLGEVELGSITDLPFADNSFDLVLATDVIEHVDDDRLALREVRRVLRPGGRALVTVPAFASLWGPQDAVAEHRRRYRLRPLCETIESAQLEVVKRYYFNYLLFVPIFVARKLLRLLRVPLRSENDLNFKLLNWLLGIVFAIDTRTAGYLRPPFGVSILAICRKPATAAQPPDDEQTATRLRAAANPARV